MTVNDAIFISERPRPMSEKIRSILTPDFLSPRKTVTKRPGPTAWLDGLRGWAALCVVIMHLTVYTHDGIELCWNTKFRHNDEFNNSFIAMPIIRLPFTGGHFAVMLFFAISGYVVPRRMLSLLHERRRQEFLESIHSAMVRRPIRLFFPVILSTIVVFISWHLFDVRPVWPDRQPNILLEAWAWVRETLIFTYFYRFGWLYTHYNPQTWTIMVELRGSMFLFVWLMMVHTFSTRHRAILNVAMTLYLGVLVPGAWYACFFGGMALSELEVNELADHKVEMPWDRWDRKLRAQEPLRTILLHVLLVFTLYIATQPSSDWSTRAETLGNCPGWQTLSWLIPYHYIDLDTQFRWYWLFWASVLLLYVVREIPWLRKSFESQTAQYLGKHSFALYLIHGPLIAIFSEKTFYMFGIKKMWAEEHKQYAWYADKLSSQPWWPLPEGGPYGMEPNFILCLIVNLPLFLYVAEIGTRLFDEPSVKVSQWAWQKVKTAHYPVAMYGAESGPYTHLTFTADELLKQSTVLAVKAYEIPAHVRQIVDDSPATGHDTVQMT